MTMEHLIKTYQQPLYRYLCHLLHNSEDAKDVLQNTWIQLYMHLGELRLQSSERAYIYRVATNCAFQWLRDEKTFDPIDDVDQEALQSLQSTPSLEMGQTLLIRLEQTILRLPPMQRAVFNLRYHEDLSYEEIAIVTDTTVGSAKANYSLAKQKISRWITSMAASVLLLITLGIGGYHATRFSESVDMVYSSEDWSEFAEDDLFLQF